VSGFLGSYLYQVDQKGRVSLPAPFRRAGDSDALVLLQVHPEALSLYPRESWAAVEERLLELSRRKPDSRHYVLRITAGAHWVRPDKQGRILIPEDLREAAGLRGEALIIGAIDKIEIWDPRRFEADVGGSHGEFEQLAASIFA